MKKLIIVASLALLAGSPALARPHHRAAPAVQNEPAATEAYGAQTHNNRTDGTDARGHVIVNGIDQGTDPDARVRLQLQIDPPVGGGL